MLEIRNIHKSFGSTPVLSGIDLDVNQGDVIAIIGPSGSGKTTLLRCLNYLEHADEGTMVFDQETFAMNKISKKDIARLRKKTAFVFQSFQNFRVTWNSITSISPCMTHRFCRISTLP